VTGCTIPYIFMPLYCIGLMPFILTCMLLQVSEMRISYTRGGLEESEMAQWQDDPMRAWAEWFKMATDLKVL